MRMAPSRSSLLWLLSTASCVLLLTCWGHHAAAAALRSDAGYSTWDHAGDDQWIDKVEEASDIMVEEMRDSIAEARNQKLLAEQAAQISTKQCSDSRCCTLGELFSGGSIMIDGLQFDSFEKVFSSAQGPDTTVVDADEIDVHGLAGGRLGFNFRGQFAFNQTKSTPNKKAVQFRFRVSVVKGARIHHTSLHALAQVKPFRHLQPGEQVQTSYKVSLGAKKEDTNLGDYYVVSEVDFKNGKRNTQLEGLQDFAGTTSIWASVDVSAETTNKGESVDLTQVAHRFWGIPLQCPDVHDVFTPCKFVPGQSCQSDDQCSLGYNCCPFGCGLRCLNPNTEKYQASERYNGYTMGERWHWGEITHGRRERLKAERDAAAAAEKAAAEKAAAEKSPPPASQTLISHGPPSKHNKPLKPKTQAQHQAQQAAHGALQPKLN